MRSFILGVVLALAIGLVGKMTLEDQVQDQELYCEMVRDGVWGDYNANYSEVCPDVRAGEEPKTVLEKEQSATPSA